MKKITLIQLIGILFVLFSSNGHTSEQKLPVMNGEEIVAMVSDDPVTMGEFNRALSSIHSEKQEEKQSSRIDYKGILDRLITMRLVRQEAINIGLNELPEVKETVERYGRLILIGLLKGEYVKKLEADDSEIDKLYRDAVREFKLKSVLFDRREEAEKIDAEVRAGGNFDDIVNRVMAAKGSKTNVEGVYFRGQDLLPQVIGALSKMEIGSVSPVVEIKDGFIILKLEDVRMPENLAARDTARTQALEFKRQQALEEYKDALIRKYVVINEEILEAVNYDQSVEDIEKYLVDARVIAEIEGEQPITVSELTEALRDNYYHGVEAAVKRKKLNDKKRLLLYDKMLQKRVFTKEALRQDIDKSPVYKSMVKEYETSALFDTFIRKVIAPDIKIGNKVVEEYYNKHITEYSSPEMMRISSIVFLKRDDAEAAAERLRKGTDFKWLSVNAAGQADKDAEGLIPFQGAVITTGDLGEGVSKAISGAAPGDIRLYADGKYYYVLYIQDVFPSKPLPIEEVKEGISEKVAREKLNDAVRDWEDKLREVYKVKVYATEF